MSAITVTRKVKESLKTARTFTIGHWSFTVITAWNGDKCPECGRPIDPGTQVYRVHDLKTSDKVDSVHPNCLGLFFKNRRGEMPRTRDEIEQLKRAWKDDPCFDIEDEPTYEEHRDKLLQFKHEQEQIWAEQNEKRRQRLSALICPVRTFGEFDTFCILEKCAWWDPDYEKCLMVLPGFLTGLQNARRENGYD